MAATGKTELRPHYRRVRKESMPAVQPLLASAALKALPALVPTGKRLGLYWPVGSEPDLRELGEADGSSLRHQLALPVVEQGQLLYRPWQPGERLSNDSCGIPAPPDGPLLAASDMALLLVPALALDRQGIRLGSGGGWYDRLRAEPAWRAVPALAVLPSACLTKELPSDPWDVPFDGWLDEQGLHWR